MKRVRYERRYQILSESEAQDMRMVSQIVDIFMYNFKHGGIGRTVTAEYFDQDFYDEFESARYNGDMKAMKDLATNIFSGFVGDPKGLKTALSIVKRNK